MVQCPFSRAAHSVFLLLGLSFGAHGDSTSPKGILFINDGIGPDGPWNYLILAVDSTDQNLTFYPSMLETPLIVNATACLLQAARCPLPTLTAWEGSAAHDLVNDENSAPWGPSNLTSLNGGYVTELMSLEGELRYISQSFTYGTQDGTKYLDNTATAVADNVTVAYPGGSWYTLGIGYISLYGGGQFTYDLPNGTDWTLELQLHNGFVLGAYPSMSYGLHMGSALHNVSAGSSTSADTTAHDALANRLPSNPTLPFLSQKYPSGLPRVVPHS